jgi:hypothetical protein
LLYILSKETWPSEAGTEPRIDATGRPVRRDYYYGSHDFTATLLWSLFKANLSNAVDGRWAAHVADFNYVVMYGTNRFLRLSAYYEGGRALAYHGGMRCGVRDNLTELTRVPVPAR